MQTNRVDFIQIVVHHRGFHSMCAAALAVGILGCGGKDKVASDRAIVSGVVTFNGRPLPAGTISFASADAYGGASVSISEGGRYTTDRAMIGANRVSIDTATIKYGNPSAYVPIPSKYADTATSGLTADIKPGTNENVNFELKSAP
jgi:hypothetical protein